VQQVLSRGELARRVRELVRADGEVVWDPVVVTGARRHAMPLTWSSRLARRLLHEPLAPGEPDSWVGELLGPSDWRLYLRRGEHYSEGGTRHLTPPVEVAVKSPDEYLALGALPRGQWWQAPFTCPYCDRLCVGREGCAHLVVRHHAVTGPWRGPALAALVGGLWRRQFNVNLANADLEGLKIKLPRVHYNTEWFRFAYWYVTGPEVLPRLEALFEASVRQQGAEVVTWDRSR
jgi:hypothetical protein